MPAETRYVISTHTHTNMLKKVASFLTQVHSDMLFIKDKRK